VVGIPKKLVPEFHISGYAASWSYSKEAKNVTPTLQFHIERASIPSSNLGFCFQYFLLVKKIQMQISLLRRQTISKVSQP
jgi:hypothetical protein